MNFRRLLLLLCFAVACGRAEDEIGFIEKFALAPDRAAVLGQLTPGTEDYYFFHALHYQHTRQAAKLKETLAQWAKRLPESEQRQVIENREALLTYDANPQATLKFLRDRLGLEFNHERETREAAPDLPTALDPKLIARSVFQEAALEDDDLNECSEEALEALVRGKVALRPEQMRALLGRLRRPDVPALVELIVKELQTDESGGFGEFEIHKALLPEQLDELARRRPELKEDEAWVYARLRKLQPGADADAEFDPAEREAWLDRAWAFAKNLAPAFNTLKAHILFRRLEHDRTHDVFDRARFLEYLKLPRGADYMNPDYLDRASATGNEAELSADLSEQLPGCAPIDSDEPLVREYLLHFLKDDPTWEPWAVWLRDTYVKPLFAEAKIVNGVGDPEKWAALLDPAEFQALRDRVDLEFPPTNPARLAPGDDVSVELFVKNAPKVMVKIYEINLLSFFLTQQRQLNTDLKLDGLLANREESHDFADPPLRRVARTFKFPELKGRRGAWVVEYIGGGKASRALIRKGQWHLIQQIGPAGDMLTVLDEAHQSVKDAAIWLDGRKFTVDEPSGFIIVPFTENPGTKPIILASAAGDFATLTKFEHHAENYHLDATFHIAREQLLAGREATVAIRTALLLNDQPMPLSLLREPRLEIRSTTLDDIVSTVEVKDLKPDPAKDFTHTFTVPERLASLEIELTARVENLAKGGEKEDVSASDEWHLNGIDATHATNDGHLTQFGGNYVFELLGKNGEPIANRQIVFKFTHREFTHEIDVALRTDAKGRIALGPLAGIASFNVEFDDERSGHWSLQTLAQTRPSVIDAHAGEPIQIPWSRPVGPASFSLLENRAGTFAADWSHAITKPGKAADIVPFLTITKLPPGDYSLRLRTENGLEEMTIRVAAGQPVRGWVIGSNRQIEVRDAAPLNINSVRVTPDTIEVSLANANPFTRVHMAAERFLPEATLFDQLAGFTRPGVGAMIPARLPNLFAGGREIGDEARYILERRQMKLFPGNMLARPGLLLNPWETRSTDLEAQSQHAGDAPASTDGTREGAGVESMAEAKSVVENPEPAETTNLDFLATAAPVLHNLVPDKDGIVRIDRKLLGDRQHVQVFAEDLASAVWRSVALPEQPTKFRDLRLARNLDPQKSFTQKKEVSVLKAGESLTFTDVIAPEMATFDSLASIYALFRTQSGIGSQPVDTGGTPFPVDTRADGQDVRATLLATFSWLLQWPTLKDDEKRAKYSEFACHELNFFLSRKDPAFFAAVVHQHVRNKKDKTFMDDFLIGADLKRYLEPWAYARLNVVERALLAQRLPDEAAAAARHLRELWEMVPPDAARDDRLFETALRGHALEEFNPPQIPQDFGNVADFDTDGLAPARKLKERAGEERRLATGEAIPAEMRGADRLGRVSALADHPTTWAAFGGVKAGTDKSVDGANRSDELHVLGEELGIPKIYSVAGVLTDPQFEVVVRGEDARRLREGVRSFYRKLGPAKEWAENNYYQLPIEKQAADLITINAFWRDYAAWDGKTPFLSPHVAEASRTFSEMMLALAVLDLPFEPGKHTTKVENGAFTLSASSPLYIFHKQIENAPPVQENAGLLITENFFSEGDRYREEGNEKFEKFVTGEFLPGVVYGANIVATNPTSTKQTVSLLTQIPRGALPVLGSKATDGTRLELDPFATKKIEVFFYFPEPGAQPFPHFPATLSRAGHAVGNAAATTFNVVKQLTQVDKTSWDYVSQDGTEAEVLAYLAEHNLARLDLERIAWRARKSVAFFRKLVALLTEHHQYDDTIFSYAVVHNDRVALREWLRHQDEFLAQCGPWLDSKLLIIDPIERRAYEHLEYSPLVNQRAHRLGAEPTIANSVFREQYQNLLRILAHKPALDAGDRLSVVYYLFLQDRIEDALAMLHATKPDALPTRLQFDYLNCYAALYEERPADARGLAARYADYPVDRWRALFAEIRAQLDEIDGKAAVRDDAKPDREREQAALASAEPALDFKVENRTIALTWKNLREVTINYYLMDPEFLFSANPFAGADSGRFAIVKPTQAATQALPEGKDALDIPLPDTFAKANVLVEILGAGLRKARTSYANTFKLVVSENYGRLEVRDQAGDHPVNKAYVKVYARLKNGTVRFFKDGYTDLRGQFDYASLNGPEGVTPASAAPPERAPSGSLDYQMLRPGELSTVAKLAVLILSESHGAAVREMKPPNE